MPLLTLDTRAVDSELQPLYASNGAPPAQGADGQCVEKQLDEILAHLLQRNARSEAAMPSPDEVGQLTEELTYEPIPPRHTHYVQTRYVFRGRGTPLPYDYDLD